MIGCINFGGEDQNSKRMRQRREIEKAKDDEISSTLQNFLNSALQEGILKCTIHLYKLKKL